jgi:hypothetical protein
MVAKSHAGLTVILVVTNLLLSVRDSGGEVGANIPLRFIWFGVVAYLLVASRDRCRRLCASIASPISPTGSSVIRACDDWFCKLYDPTCHANIGLRTDDWHYAHLFNLRTTVLDTEVLMSSQEIDAAAKLYAANCVN